jgi:hypothetical protein
MGLSQPPGALGFAIRHRHIYGSISTQEIPRFLAVHPQVDFETSAKRVSAGEIRQNDETYRVQPPGSSSKPPVRVVQSSMTISVLGTQTSAMLWTISRSPGRWRYIEPNLSFLRFPARRESPRYLERLPMAEHNASDDPFPYCEGGTRGFVGSAASRSGSQAKHPQELNHVWSGPPTCFSCSETNQLDFKERRKQRHGNHVIRRGASAVRQVRDHERTGGSGDQG